VETVRNVARCQVPSLAQLRPDLPADLIEAVHCALARDPAARFPSARAMTRALSQVLRKVAEPTDAEPIGQSVALARQRLGLPPRSAPPEDLSALRRSRNAALLKPPGEQ
jgi:hypothetical protein